MKEANWEKEDDAAVGIAAGTEPFALFPCVTEESRAGPGRSGKVGQQNPWDGFPRPR